MMKLLFLRLWLKLRLLFNKSTQRIVDTFPLLALALTIIVFMFVIPCYVMKVSQIQLINIVYIVLGMAAVAFYNEISYKKIKGISFKLSKSKNRIHMRGIRLDKEDAIKNSNSIKEVNANAINIFKKDIVKLCEYLKENNISKFEANTHKFFYIQLLDYLQADPNLGFSYTTNDLDKIKALDKQGDNYEIKNDKCKVNFTLKEKNKLIIERSFLFSYKKLLTATQAELDEIVIYRTTYTIKFDVEW